LAAIEYYGTGRRKTSTARVFLRPGKGVITINHREFDKFFTTDALRTQVRRPLLLTETGDRFDILATVDGGGVNGQAGAVRLGIARALVEEFGMGGEQVGVRRVDKRGEHDHGPELFRQSVGVRPVGHVHGDGERDGARGRHAHGDGHVQGWRNSAGHQQPERHVGHLYYHRTFSGFAPDYGGL